MFPQHWHGSVCEELSSTPLADAALMQWEAWLIPMSFQELWSRCSEDSVLPWKVYSVQMLWGGEQGWTIKEKDIPA